MSVGVYRLSYKDIHGHAEVKEVEFIENCFDLNETGSYYISKDTLETALETARKERMKAPKTLVAGLKKELKKGDFDIQVF
jgi:hypothetical protein